MFDSQSASSLPAIAYPISPKIAPEAPSTPRTSNATNPPSVISATAAIAPVRMKKAWYRSRLVARSTTNPNRNNATRFPTRWPGPAWAYVAVNSVHGLAKKVGSATTNRLITPRRPSGIWIRNTPKITITVSTVGLRCPRAVPGTKLSASMSGCKSPTRFTPLTVCTDCTS